MKYIDYFKEISAIPRESGSEKAVSEYLVKFASDRGLKYSVDELYNVLIVKGGGSGEPIMLQSHTDMVCEKNSDINHDFANEGIKLIESDGFYTADGTTLGADNGIGVAYMLAVLDDTTLNHPTVECLFTAQEEIGLIGAEKFDYSIIKSRRIINLDGETEGEAIISSAGGVRTTLRMNYETVPVVTTNKTMRINITGLMGGHSGADIHLRRGNANIIMGRILNKIYADSPFNLVSLNGGLKTNAIPRECEAVIHVIDYDRTAEIIRNLEKEIRNELSKDDRKFKVTLKKSAADKVMTYKSTSTAITTLMLSLNGIMSQSDNMVEASSNLGVIRTAETLNFLYENRSSVESMLDFICEKYDRLAYITSAEITHTNRYPGWQYNPSSHLKENYRKIYNKLYGVEPEINGIHAGLECGLIINRLGDDVDAISIGPNITGAHTPDEKLDIKSCEKVWNLLKELICGENQH
jgi:aminoacyl-histidine dipeptidase